MIDLEKISEKAWNTAHDPDLDQFEACVMLKDAAMAIKQAQETIAALEKDAGRYRYLRDSSKKELWDGLMNTFPFATEAFDNKIDTAMEAKHG